MKSRRGWSDEEQKLGRFCRLPGNGVVAFMACGNVDIVQSADWIVKGG